MNGLFPRMKVGLLVAGVALAVLAAAVVVRVHRPPVRVGGAQPH